ncbi:unnamed protein product, partial [Brassica oleracea]
MFSWKGLSFVASPTGVPDRLHPETAQCLNMKVAKIFFKTDLTKELPKSLVFNFHGKATKVEYFYPWLPKSCLVNANNPNKNNGERSDSLEKDTNVTDTQKELETQSVGEEREKREDTNNMATETEKEEPQVVEKEVSKMQTLIWLEITPGKGSRSPKTKNLKEDQTLILSNSRFSVLSTDEEETVEDQAENHTETQKEDGEIVEKT